MPRVVLVPAHHHPPVPSLLLSRPLHTHTLRITPLHIQPVMTDSTSGPSDIAIFLKLHALYQASPELGAEKAYKQLLEENPGWVGKVSLKVRRLIFSSIQLA